MTPESSDSHPESQQDLQSSQSEAGLRVTSENFEPSQAEQSSPHGDSSICISPEKSERQDDNTSSQIQTPTSVPSPTTSQVEDQGPKVWAILICGPITQDLESDKCAEHIRPINRILSKLKNLSGWLLIPTNLVDTVVVFVAGHEDDVNNGIDALNKEFIPSEATISSTRSYVAYSEQTFYKPVRGPPRCGHDTRYPSVRQHGRFEPNKERP